MSWTKNFFVKKFGINKDINWIRTDQNKILKCMSINTKRNWLWVQYDTCSV